MLMEAAVDRELFGLGDFMRTRDTPPAARLVLACLAQGEPRIMTRRITSFTIATLIPWLFTLKKPQLCAPDLFSRLCGVQAPAREDLAEAMRYLISDIVFVKRHHL